MCLIHTHLFNAIPPRGRSVWLSLLVIVLPLGLPSARADNDAPMRTDAAPLLQPGIENAAAWQKLPRVAKGGGQALPAWARALVPSLPHTTAAMLELDYRQRTQGDLPPKLRAMLRWTAAHALGCAYAEAYAAADLRRSGGTADLLQALRKNGAGLPQAERTALAFARKITIEPDAATDQEVAQLVGHYREKQVVAMVLLLAYANFQDRLSLALDLPLEAGGPLAPLDVRFAPIPLGTHLAVPRPQPIGVPNQAPAVTSAKDGHRVDFAALRKQIEKQRSRKPRISLPSGDGTVVHWGAVCRTYQPQLAAAWALCQHHFSAEADQDPVYATSVFWIVSHAQQSYY